MTAIIRLKAFILHDYIAKLRISNEICVTIWLQKFFKGIDTEDAVVAYLAALAGGKQLDVTPASVKKVSQVDSISEFEDRAVGFLSPLRCESGQRPITKR